MRKSLLIACVALAAASLPVSAGPHRLGVGAHYWTTVKDIDIDNIDIDKNGLSWLASYQFKPVDGWIGVEALVEWFKKGFGGSTEDVWQPQAFFILGKGLYGAAGIGTSYTDGEWADQPFFALRAGFDIAILPMLNVDINANYRFDKWDDLSAEGSKIDTDTITVGATARLVF